MRVSVIRRRTYVSINTVCHVYNFYPVYVLLIRVNKITTGRICEVQMYINTESRNDQLSLI